MKDKKRNKLIAFVSIIVVLCVALVLVIKSYNKNVYQNASLPHRDVVCEDGQYFSEGECLLCPVGSYCYDNNRYVCPEGTGSLAESTTVMNCTNCAKGYYSNGDGAGCVKCPNGMTTDGVGTTSIDYCK